MKSERIQPGQRFGRWTVAARAGSRRTPGGSCRPYWLCKCQCGTTREVQAVHLRSGRSLSCGCWKSEAAAIQKTTHGRRHTALYEVWTQMVQRCENPKNKAFPRYGGRGITVCADWHEFAGFLRDMGSSYEEGLTIDRENNDGPYALGNCRWVPNKVNCRNTPRTLKVLWEGKKVPLNELAERHGIKTPTVYGRFRLKGWTLRQALGVDPAPPLQRPPISEVTRQKMRDAALLRWQRNRETRS